MARGQAERLVPMLEEMLAEAGLGWRDLDALGVCTGPGNFTGIRISVSAARGLALALDVPIEFYRTVQRDDQALPLTRGDGGRRRRRGHG